MHQLASDISGMVFSKVMPVEEEGIAWNKDWALTLSPIKKDKPNIKVIGKDIENRFIDLARLDYQNLKIELFNEPCLIF